VVVNLYLSALLIVFSVLTAFCSLCLENNLLCYFTFSFLCAGNISSELAQIYSDNRFKR
jgi:hypothetical protein